MMASVFEEDAVAVVDSVDLVIEGDLSVVSVV